MVEAKHLTTISRPTLRYTLRTRTLTGQTVPPQTRQSKPSCSSVETALPLKPELYRDHFRGSEAPAAKRCRNLCFAMIAAFQLRQYDEPHDLFGDDLPVLFGPHHLWAEEVAGDRAPSWQGAQRIQTRLKRVQGANRAGDFALGR